MNTHTITIEVPKICTNRKMQAIAEQSARNLLSLFADCEEELQDSITKAEEAKVNLSHTITLDLGKSKQTDKLSFSLKRGDEICQSIPDPDQPELFKEKPVRGASNKDDESPALVGLPAPVVGIGMIVDAEIVSDHKEESQDEEGGEEE